MKTDFIIYTKMLKIISWLFAKVNTFPKKQRFVLGQQIQNSAMDCLRYIVEANNFKTPELVIEKLERLNVELEVLRSLLRVAFDVHFIKANSLGYIISEIDEVGKMRGGWARRYQKSFKSNRES